MKEQELRRRRVATVPLLLMVLVGVPGWLVIRAYRQARLDHALIAANSSEFLRFCVGRNPEGG